MTITLVNSSVSPSVTTTLVDGQQRYQNGNATGPDNLKMNISPGVVLREYVGADRVQGEHVKCDHGTITFDVTRIFETPELALEYVRSSNTVTGKSFKGFLGEESEGALYFGANQVFAQAAVTNRAVAVVGCAVAVSYTIEG